MPVEMKRCKVYPRNGLQFIPGILEKQKRIEFPAELPLSPHEMRRCLSYADVYEVRDDDTCVLLTMENYLADNTDAPEATDVPEDELLYPRDEKEEEGEEEAEIRSEEPPKTEPVAKAAATNPAVANAKKEYTSPKASKQYQGQQKVAQTSEAEKAEEKKVENK